VKKTEHLIHLSMKVLL